MKSDRRLLLTVVVERVVNIDELGQILQNPTEMGFVGKAT